MDNVLRDPSLLDPYQYIQTVLNLRGVMMMAMTMTTMIFLVMMMMRLILTTCYFEGNYIFDSNMRLNLGDPRLRACVACTNDNVFCELKQIIHVYPVLKYFLLPRQLERKNTRLRNPDYIFKL